MGAWESVSANAVMNIFGLHLSNMATAVGAFVAVYAAFGKFDADQSPANRRFVRDWLMAIRIDETKWKSVFQELFAKLFGKHHLSVQCAIRSCLFSLFIVGTIYLWYLWHHQIEFEGHYEIEVIDVIRILLTACIADYLALWKTRFILTQLDPFENLFVVVLAVLADAGSTISLYILALVLNLMVVALYYGALDLSPAGIKDYFILVLSSDYNIFVPVKELVSAALFTSAWLWIFIIVAYFARALSSLPVLLRSLSTFMDFEQHPVRTLGYVAAGFTAITVWLWTSFVFDWPE